MRLSVRIGSMQFDFVRIFKDRPHRTGYVKGRRTLAAPSPHLRVKRFEGRRAVSKKRKLFPEG